MAVLSMRNRKRLSKHAATKPKKPPPSSLNALEAALLRLQKALGDFLVGEAERHALPVRLVAADGSNTDWRDRKEQTDAVDAATAALQDLLIKGILDSATPAMREAILASQRHGQGLATVRSPRAGDSNELDGRDESQGVPHDDDQASPAANGETTSSSAGSQGTEPPGTASEAAT